MSRMTYGQSKKRNVFFSFHYADVMQVNNVRKSGEFKQTSSDTGRSIEGFNDYSLWESRRLNGDDALKRLIREGVQNTSVVCVLVGSKT
ncbi:TIR domain-containing protein [Bradyrhizobium xenonodulans]|uniref:TIR domain-containing protein n=1 Tax=Bradyrhizobium xenonodulans TaxID=2736875 RepID=A0ABY7MN94_9BRAD|nr:TIR domain-containing protein [Bradyrhizobium xenonodulans]WBL78137.1 TIR domain-containing protein [Bradyrhizobium xenonodulans]